MDYLANYIANLNYSLKTNRLYAKVPFSTFTYKVSSILYRNGYLVGYRRIIIDNKKYLYLQLKYFSMRKPLFSVHLISKGKSRVYWSVDKLSNELSRLNSPYTQFVISTSYGLLLSNDALYSNTSGQVLFRIN